MTLSKLIAIIAVAGMFLGPWLNIEPEVQRRTEHRAHLIHTQLDEQYAEAYERLFGWICADVTAGSQVVRVQKELQKRNELPAEICR